MCIAKHAASIDTCSEDSKATDFILISWINPPLNTFAMPKTSQSRYTSHVSDISSALIAELTHLPAKVLRLYLLSQHLITIGNKATLARRLHEALDPTVPTTMADSASFVMVPPPTSTPSTALCQQLKLLHRRFVTSITTAVLLAHAAVH